MPPFLLGESHGVTRMGMARILGFCSALLFASSLSAATTIDLGPSDYRNYGSGTASHTSGGVRSSFGQTVRMPPMNTNLSVSRNPVVPYGSIANGLRNFTRITPGSIAASAAITGLFLAVDWVFDQASGEWVTMEAEIDDSAAIWEVSRNGYNRRGATPDEACINFGNQPGWNNLFNRFESVTITGPTTGNCHYSDRDATVIPLRRFGSCPAGSGYNVETGVCEKGLVPVPLSGADWQELEASLPNAPAVQVRDAASDAQRQIGSPLPGYTDTAMTGPSSVSGPETTSTSTDPVTGDTIVTNTSTQTNINYGDTTITTTTTTTSTTYQNGQQTGETVTTETPGELPVSSGGGAAGDWPGFCEWASVVCDWFNWTQEEPPPEQDLPAVIDDDFYTERDISFGSKSCPEPYQVNLAPFMDTQVSVSFQPLCDFAGLIYYMVMAASYIIAAYISIGVARA